MAYQRAFKATQGFELYVKPFISKLPSSSSDPPLVLTVHISEEHSAKYQWYNYLHHFHRAQFVIRTELVGSHVHMKLFRLYSSIKEAPQQDYLDDLDDQESLSIEELARTAEAAARKEASK